MEIQELMNLVMKRAEVVESSEIDRIWFEQHSKRLFQVRLADDLEKTHFDSEYILIINFVVGLCKMPFRGVKLSGVYSELTDRDILNLMRLQLKNGFGGCNDNNS